MRGRRRADLACAAAVAALSAMAGPAHAQRAAENVVRQATDAFGLSIGAEKIGVYSEDSVRGFSPSASGNIRIDGLYYDRRAGFNLRLLQGAQVRVGLTAQGYDFPAPSGIADFILRRPAKDFSLSVSPTLDSWGSRIIEVDLGLKPNDKVAIQAGFSKSHEETNAGVDRSPFHWSGLVDYTPAADWRLTAFVAGTRLPNDTATSAIFTGGAFLPSIRPSRAFYGQEWAEANTRFLNAGLILKGRHKNTGLRAGVFYSNADQIDLYSDQYVNATLTGTSGHIFSALKDQVFASVSGEVKLDQTINEGPRRHVLLASVRFRSRDDEYGGNAITDFGPTRIGTDRQYPQPVFNFARKTHEALQQRNYGVSYQGVWPGKGALTAGLQQVDYSRDVDSPTAGTTRNDETYWLYNLNAAVELAPWAVAYAGYTRGIEDAGLSPGNSANPNSVLAPVQSKQVDAGVRLVSKRVRVLAGVFRIEKPVYGLDARNVFTILGDVRSTGAEFSITATLRDDLRAVGGLVLAKPRVEQNGRRNPPVASTDSQGLLSVEYTPRGQETWSFDLNLNHQGKKAARNDSSLFIPAQTLLGVGSRYRFRLPMGGHATLRTTVGNVFDKRAWNVLAGQGFVPVAIRKFSVTLLADF